MRPGPFGAPHGAQRWLRVGWSSHVGDTSKHLHVAPSPRLGVSGIHAPPCLTFPLTRREDAGGHVWRPRPHPGRVRGHTAACSSASLRTPGSPRFPDKAPVSWGWEQVTKQEGARILQASGDPRLRPGPAVGLQAPGQGGPREPTFSLGPGLWHRVAKPWRPPHPAPAGCHFFLKVVALCPLLGEALPELPMHSCAQQAPARHTRPTRCSVGVSPAGK